MNRKEYQKRTILVNGRGARPPYELPAYRQAGESVRIYEWEGDKESKCHFDRRRDVSVVTEWRNLLFNLKGEIPRLGDSLGMTAKKV